MDGAGMSVNISHFSQVYIKEPQETFTPLRRKTSTRRRGSQQTGVGASALLTALRVRTRSLESSGRFLMPTSSVRNFVTFS